MPDNGSHRNQSRRRFLQMTGAAGTVGATFLAGCSSGSGSGGGGGTTKSGGNGGKLSDLTVGVLEPYSGTYSFLGEAETQGAELAVKDLESEFDIDITVKKADTEVDPAVGVEKLKRLTTRENVDIAMGGVSSSVAIKMGQWASQNGLGFVASGSHSDATTGSSCAQHMFRTPSSNTMLARTAGKAFVDYAKKWSLLYADYTWGQTGRDAMAKVITENGGEVVNTIAAPLAAKDVSQELNTVAESDADAMAVIFAGIAQRRVIQQFVNKGLHKEMKMGGPLLEDAVFWGLPKDVVQHTGVWASVWTPAIQSSEGLKSFLNRVKEEYGTTAYSRHYLGYTSMDQLVRGAIRAGTADAEKWTSSMEGHDYSDHGLLDGTEKWRASDHQNLKKTYAAKALPKEEMKDEPYKVWFEPFGEAPASKTARTGDHCQL